MDIGCGDGKLTARIARASPNGTVIGIDKSKNMVDFAGATFSREEYPNLSFQIGDAQQFQTEKKFDLIVSLNTLHWVPNQLSVLQTAKKHLKKMEKSSFCSPQNGNTCLLRRRLTA